jgi:hypothetical protein
LTSLFSLKSSPSVYSRDLTNTGDRFIMDSDDRPNGLPPFKEIKEWRDSVLRARLLPNHPIIKWLDFSRNGDLPSIPLPDSKVCSCSTMYDPAHAKRSVDSSTDEVLLLQCSSHLPIRSRGAGGHVLQRVQDYARRWRA